MSETLAHFLDERASFAQLARHALNLRPKSTTEILSRISLELGFLAVVVQTRFFHRLIQSFLVERIDALGFGEQGAAAEA